MFIRPVSAVGVVASVVAALFVSVTPVVAADAAPGAAQPAVEGDYTTVESAVLLDTRPGGETVDARDAGGGAVTRTPRTVPVTGRGGVPATGVAAVMLNVTASAPTVDGFVTVYPAGQARPKASSLQVTAGAVTANLVAVKVGSDGGASFVVSSGSAHLRAAVVGYFPTGGSFTALAPARLMDTKVSGSTVDGEGEGGGPLAAGETRSLPVLGREGIPTTGVAAVVLNLTAHAQSGATAVTAFPSGAPRPAERSLHVNTGEKRSNLVIVAPGSDGAVSLRNRGTGTAALLVDVAGWIPTGTSYATLAPGRLLDTRASGSTVDGAGAAGGAVGPGESVDVPVTGRHGIPTSGVSAVVLNVTGVAPLARTGVTAYAADEPRPGTANLNLVAGATRSNLVVSRVSDQGVVRLSSSAGTTHLLVDVVGYVTTPTGVSAIEGTVTDAAGGSPLAFVQVVVSWNGDGESGESRDVETDPYGRYLFEGLAPGSDYRVCFRPPNKAPATQTTTGNLALCHGADSRGEGASMVTLTAGSTTTVDAALPPGGAIAGVVTDAAAAGGPLSGVPVQVRSASGGHDLTTDAEGRYRLIGLAPASDYTVCFMSPAASGAGETAYVTECYDDVDWRAPTPLTVTVGATTTADASLSRVESQAQALTGVVTDGGPDGAPLPGVYVTVMTDLDRGLEGDAVTGPDGRYRIEGLPTGMLLAVCFSPKDTGGAGSSPTGYLRECHENWDEREQDWPPTMVTFSTGDTTIDAGLRHAAAVTGVVTDSRTGAALAGVQVDVGAQRVTTDALGRYRAEGLRPSTSGGVCFSASSQTGDALQTLYLDACSDSGVFATDVVTTLDLALDPAGSLTGMVTDAVDGDPVAGVGVHVELATREWSATTGADGRYRLDGLVVGADYRVCFLPEDATGAGSAAGYLRECYDDLPDGPGATPVSVTSGVPTTIDADLSRAAAVTGVVTDATGAAVVNVGVHVSGGPGDSWGFTDSQGRYLAPRLVPGAGYTVCFETQYADGGSTTGYVDECHDDVVAGGTPTPVTLTGGTLTTIDAVLGYGAAVAGVVTGEGAEPLADVRVTVSGGGTTAESWTGDDGRYRAVGLPSGSDYLVCFDGSRARDPNWTMGFETECHDGIAEGAPATPVTLTQGATTTIDATLARLP